MKTTVPGTERDRRTMGWLAIGGLALCYGLPEVHIAGGLGNSTEAFTVGREIVWWSIALAVLLYVRFVERRPLASIGLRRPTRMSFAIGLATAVVLFASFIAIYAVVFPMFGLTVNREAAARITRHSASFQVLLALRAAVVEEIVYRGYPIARIAEVTGSKWAAAIVSVVVFTVVHVGYWGTAQLLIVAPAAVVLAALFLWRRDLACNMTAHFLVDLAGFAAATLQTR